MTEQLVHNATPEDLIELTKASPTVQVDVPRYLSDGRTRARDENGRLVLFKITLHRPTAAQGIEFGKFRRGELKKKKLKQPSQQEVAIKALRICVPSFQNATVDELLNVLVHTGGYLGDNAVLANACLRLLGENFDEDEDTEEETPKWASDAVVPT